MEFTPDSIRKLQEDALGVEVRFMQIAMGVVKRNFSAMGIEYSHGLPDDDIGWSLADFKKYLSLDEVQIALDSNIKDLLYRLIHEAEQQLTGPVNAAGWAKFIQDMHLDNSEMVEELATVFADEAEAYAMQFTQSAHEEKFTNEAEQRSAEEVETVVRNKVRDRILQLLQKKEDS